MTSGPRSNLWLRLSGRASALASLVQGSIATWSDVFLVDRPCAYRTDLPWYLFVIPAQALGLILRQRHPETKRPLATPFTIAAVWLLLIPTPLIVASATQGVLLGAKVQRPLLIDWRSDTILVMFLLGILLAYSFYTSLFRTFGSMFRSGVVNAPSADHIQHFMDDLENKCNWPVVVPIWGVLATVTTLGVGLQEGPETSWIGELPDLLQVYNLLIDWMAYFCLLFFAWKALVVWKAIRDISLRRRSLQWVPQYPSLDGCAGLSPIARLWFRVHLMIVLVGTYLYVAASSPDLAVGFPTLIGLMAGFALIAYAALAPALFFGPLYSVHKAMVAYKRTRQEETYRRLHSAIEERDKHVPQADSTVAAVAFWTQKVSEAAQLPTWPLNTGILTGFWGTFALPFVVGILSNWASRLLGF